MIVWLHIAALLLLPLVGAAPLIEPDNEASLVKALLEKYDTRSRPVYNITTTTIIDLSMYLVQILKLSEKDQILTSNVWLILAWKDEFLRWDEKDWKIQEIRIPAKHLWLPDLTLYNNAQEADPIVANMLASTALVTFDGNVTLWPRPLILESNCEIDVRFFPMDIQKCHLQFSSWAYGVQQVNLTTQVGGLYLNEYIPSTEWELEYCYNQMEYLVFEEDNSAYSFIKFHITIRRKALYYIVNLIMPCLMLTLVMLFGQYLPCNSGDAKVQLGTALFTSMCVFLLLVGTMMPPSDKQPLLGLYYGVTLFLIVLSTAINVLVLNVMDRETPLPRWVRLLFLYYVARFVAPQYKQEYPTRECVEEDPPATPMSCRRDNISGQSTKLESAFTSLNKACSPGLYVNNGGQASQSSPNHLAANNHHSCATPERFPVSFSTARSSFRLAVHGDNTSCYRPAATTQLPESPIKELKQLKLDDNGRLLCEVKRHLKDIRAFLEVITATMERKTEKERLKNDWLDVATVLDRSLMIVFTLFTAATTLYVYQQYPTDLINGQ